MLTIIGNWNAKVESKADSNVIGNLDKGSENKAGDQLTDL